MHTCPACDCIDLKPFVRPNGAPLIGVDECRGCSAVFGQCYKGDASSVVLPYFETGDSIANGTARYYDLTILGSAGIERVHGWRNPITRKIAQTG